MNKELPHEFSTLNEGCRAFIKGFHGNLPNSDWHQYRVAVYKEMDNAFVMLFSPEIACQIAVVENRASLLFDGQDDPKTFDGTPYDAGRSFAEIMVKAAE